MSLKPFSPALRHAHVVAFVLGFANCHAQTFSLAELNARLLRENPDIGIAAGAARGSEALVRSADTAPNPTLSYGASSINTMQGLGAGPLKDKRVDQVLRIDKTFERGDKRARRTDAALAGARASKLDLQDAVRMARMQLVSAYYDLLSAQDRAAAADEAQKSSEKLSRMARLRQKEGDLSLADLTRIDIDLSRAANDAQSARLDVLRTQQALSLLFNDKPARAYVALDHWPADGGDGPGEDAIGQMAERRPDVQAAQQRVEQARQTLALAESQRRRDIALGAQVERNPAQTAGVTFGVFMSVPLFFGNDFSGDIDKARADLNSAELQMDKLRGTARGELRRMAAELSSLSLRWLRYRDDILPNVVRSTRAADLAFRSGAISIADLLDAQRTARALQAEAVQAHADFAKSQLNVEILKQESP